MNYNYESGTPGGEKREGAEAFSEESSCEGIMHGALLTRTSAASSLPLPLLQFSPHSLFTNCYYRRVTRFNDPHMDKQA